MNINTPRIRDLITRGYLKYNMNRLKRTRLKRTRYTDLMWGNELVNKMTNKNVRASILTVNKNNNKKRFTWTGDDNHCAPTKKPTFRKDKLLFFKDKQQQINQLLDLHFNCKACKSTEKTAMALHHSLNKIKLKLEQYVRV